MDRITQLWNLLAGLRPVDLAPRLERGIPRWPSHPHLVIDPTVVHARDGYYCQTLAMAEHTGCHVDAPAHIHADMMAVTIDVFPAAHLIAPAVVYDFSDRDWQPGQLLDARDIADYEARHGVGVGAGEIALVNFGWL